MKISGAFSLIDSLIQNGTKYIFGYPGGAILPLYDELYIWEKQGLIKHILFRQEQGAIHAADAYSRVTNNVGICFTTSGPGATNLITGIANAKLDSISILIITGQVATFLIGTDSFQEIDIFAITLPIVKHSYRICNARTISQILTEAFFLTKNGRPGPVLLDFSKNLFLDKFEKYKFFKKKQFFEAKGCRYEFKSTKKKFLKILNLLQNSTQPILYIGGGLITSQSENELKQFSELFQLPITNTLMGKGSFDEKHFLALGLLGLHGTPYANFSISACTLLVAIGARFDDRVTGKLENFAYNAEVIHIDIDPAEVAKNLIPQISILGDAKIILQELLNEQTSLQKFNLCQTIVWRKKINLWKKTYPLFISLNIFKISAQEILDNISSLRPAAFFTTDVGYHQMASAQFLKCLPYHWASSSGLGTMGFGLPAAIGIQIAFPNRTVICITGDASFQMNSHELATVSKYNLPIKIIIMNNQWQGMVRQWQQAFYSQRYSHSNMEQGSPNFSLLSNSFGIKSFKLETRQNLNQKLEKMLRYNGPLVIETLINKTENCYPMVVPGNNNSTMLALVNKFKKKKIYKPQSSLFVDSMIYSSMVYGIVAFILFKRLLKTLKEILKNILKKLWRRVKRWLRELFERFKRRLKKFLPS